MDVWRRQHTTPTPDYTKNDNHDKEPSSSSPSPLSMEKKNNGASSPKRPKQDATDDNVSRKRPVSATDQEKNNTPTPTVAIHEKPSKIVCLGRVFVAAAASETGPEAGYDHNHNDQQENQTDDNDATVALLVLKKDHSTRNISAEDTAAAAAAEETKDFTTDNAEKENENKWRTEPDKEDGNIDDKIGKGNEKGPHEKKPAAAVTTTTMDVPPFVIPPPAGTDYDAWHRRAWIDALLREEQEARASSGGGPTGPKPTGLPSPPPSHPPYHGYYYHYNNCYYHPPYASPHAPTATGSPQVQDKPKKQEFAAEKTNAAPAEDSTGHPSKLPTKTSRTQEKLIRALETLRGQHNSRPVIETIKRGQREIAWKVRQPQPASKDHVIDDYHLMLGRRPSGKNVSSSHDAFQLEAILAVMSQSDMTSAARTLINMLRKPQLEPMRKMIGKALLLLDDDNNDDDDDNSPSSALSLSGAAADTVIMGRIRAFVKRHVSKGTRHGDVQQALDAICVAGMFGAPEDESNGSGGCGMGKHVSGTVTAKRLGISKKVMEVQKKRARELYEGGPDAKYEHAKRKPRQDKLRDFSGAAVRKFCHADDSVVGGGGGTILDKTCKPSKSTIQVTNPETGQVEPHRKRIWKYPTCKQNYQAFLKSEYFAKFQQEHGETATISYTVFRQETCKCVRDQPHTGRWHAKYTATTTTTASEESDGLFHNDNGGDEDEDNTNESASGEPNQNVADDPCARVACSGRYTQYKNKTFLTPVPNAV